MVGLAVSLILGLSRLPDPLADISKKYGVQVDVIAGPYTWRGDGYQVEAQAPPADDLAKYTKLFASEWNRYLVSAIKTAKLKRIVLCSSLKLSGQVRAAVPAFEANTMYYDTSLGNYNAAYQRLVIHHEFFHTIDFLQGKLSRDAEWYALNPPGFQYGKGGDKMRTQGAGALTDKIPGALTFYATSALEEDKAELYGHLLVDPEYVAKRIEADDIIAKKVALLKSRLKKWDASFDEAFWNSKALDH